MISNEVNMHYDSPGLYERIVHGLKAIGKSPASVDLDDLAALDEFHLCGPAATRELIELLDVGEDSHVLDVGSGLGGPARRLSKAAGSGRGRLPRKRSVERLMPLTLPSKECRTSAPTLKTVKRRYNHVRPSTTTRR